MITSILSFILFDIDIIIDFSININVNLRYSWRCTILYNEDMQKLC